MSAVVPATFTVHLITQNVEITTVSVHMVTLRIRMDFHVEKVCLILMTCFLQVSAMVERKSCVIKKRYVLSQLFFHLNVSAFCFNAFFNFLNSFYNIFRVYSWNFQNR